MRLSRNHVLERVARFRLYFRLEYGIAKRLASYYRARLTLSADILNSPSRFCTERILFLETVTISVPESKDTIKSAMKGDGLHFELSG